MLWGIDKSWPTENIKLEDVDLDGHITTKCIIAYINSMKNEEHDFDDIW